jgi:hypothetical protein
VHIFQLLGLGIREALKEEVMEYTFGDSMFDVVVI